MDTENDNTVTKNIDENGFVFYRYVLQATIDVDKVLQYINMLKELEMKALSLEADIAILLQHDLFHSIEDLKMCIKEEVIQTTEIVDENTQDNLHQDTNTQKQLYDQDTKHQEGFHSQDTYSEKDLRRQNLDQEDLSRQDCNP